MRSSAVDAITRRALTGVPAESDRMLAGDDSPLPVSFTLPRIPCVKPKFRQQQRIMQIVRSRFIVTLMSVPGRVKFSRWAML
jgi:hypothetical protein